MKKKNKIKARLIVFLLFLILSQFLAIFSKNNPVLKREIYQDRQDEVDSINHKSDKKMTNNRTYLCR